MVPFTYAALRRLLAVSQSSLIKYVRELEANRWLLINRTGRYTVELQAAWPLPCKVVVLPEDILLDRALPHAARWLWGVIQRLGPGYTYQQLIALTGYCHNSLTKYIGILQDRGWLGREATRVDRRKVFGGEVKNPPEEKRQEALKAFLLSMQVAVDWAGNPRGQFLMSRMVELRTQTHTVENGAANYLDNQQTGGRMQIDLLLTKHGVALEFQGLQHKMPTQLYPGEERLKAQQQRDNLKRKWLEQAGLKLIEIWPHQLSFKHIEVELTAAGVPLMPIPDEKRYVYLALVHLAAEYRASVARHSA